MNGRAARPRRAARGERRGRALTAALAVSAALAVTALTGWAPPGLAAAGTPGARRAAAAQAPVISIDSINPSFARPGATVTVSGHFSNGTGALPQGLDVQLWSSATPFSARSQLQDFAGGSFQADGYAQVAAVAVTTAGRPGQTVTWHASFNTGDVGMRPGGVAVYPLAAAAFDPAQGAQIAVERTFLPFWPGRQAAGQPVRIGWVWPLIDQPHRGVCTPMLDNSLAASLGNGRLAGLLSTGRDYASSARLTWAVDPALLDDAEAMTRGYQVLDGPSCAHFTSEPASSAARTWLAGLQVATETGPVFATPYADPDVAALTHRGLDDDLAASLRDGSAVAARFLAEPDRTMAWPPGGIADTNVVDNLLVQGGSVRGGSVQGSIQTLVLDGSMMPPLEPGPYYTPDAVAQVHTGIGATVRVLLADHVLTAVLGAGSAGPAAAGTIVTSQRFLAETAMIAAEAPGYSRSVVVAPPRRWNPGTALAAQLLSDTVHAPWLRPASLGSLRPAAPPPGVPAAGRALLPANFAGPQLSPQYLRGVRDLGNDTRLLSSFVSQSGPAYRLVLARLESSAWRGAGEARGRQLLSQADDFVGSQERMVSIIRSSEVTLGGSRGTIPVSIGNRLRAAVQVRLEAIVPATRALPASARLSVAAAPQQLITIGPRLKQTVRLQVHAPSAGVTEIRLRLLTPQGVPIPGSDATLKVRATAFGTLALVIVAVALGVLVITFVARMLRRGLREGRAGNVVPEDNGTDDDGSAEAPDELADARGRAQPDARQ